DEHGRVLLEEVAVADLAADVEAPAVHVAVHGEGAGGAARGGDVHDIGQVRDRGARRGGVDRGAVAQLAEGVRAPAVELAALFDDAGVKPAGRDRQDVAVDDGGEDGGGGRHGRRRGAPDADLAGVVEAPAGEVAIGDGADVGAVPGDLADFV